MKFPVVDCAYKQETWTWAKNENEMNTFGYEKSRYPNVCILVPHFQSHENRQY